MCVSALPAWNLLSGQTGKDKVSTFFKSQVNLLSYTAFKQPNSTTTSVPSVNMTHTKLSIINKTKFCFKQKIRVAHVGKTAFSPETVFLPKVTTSKNSLPSYPGPELQLQSVGIRGRSVFVAL